MEARVFNICVCMLFARSVPRSEDQEHPCRGAHGKEREASHEELTVGGLSHSVRQDYRIWACDREGWQGSRE